MREVSNRTFAFRFPKQAPGISYQQSRYLAVSNPAEMADADLGNDGGGISEWNRGVLGQHAVRRQPRDRRHRIGERLPPELRMLG
jgi:hypothetical protein